MDSEKSIEAKLVKMIKTKGGLCVKIPAGFFNGFPDRICLLPKATIFFVEVKSEGEKPSPLQRTIHITLAKLGFTVLVIDRLYQVDDLSKII